MVHSPFLALSYPALVGLATALDANRLALPIQPAHLAAYVSVDQLSAIATELNRLHQQGMTTQQIAYMLNLVIAERQASQNQRDRVELVWTGLETPGTESRDTRVVVQELFNRADRSALISSYALDLDRKGQSLFWGLATRMDQLPHLRVRLFLNIKRPHGSHISEIALLQAFAQNFRQQVWTGKRLPEVFYDSRSLSKTLGSKTCLHAKCVIIDDQYLLITSANFTEAAHERNLEAGILLKDSAAAKGMKLQFERLVQSGQLKSLNEFFAW